jgi:hypothetical protein
MRLIISPAEGTDILRVMTFSSVSDMGANIAPGEKAHLLPEGLGLVDDSRLCVANNVLTLKTGFEGQVQHAGEQVLPHTFQIFGGATQAPGATEGTAGA